MYLADDRQHIGRMTIRIGLYGLRGDFTRLGEVRASELRAAS
jgi:hypothetical protein